MHQITIEEATAHIASVLADVLHGEEVILTEHEKPVAKVMPFNGGLVKRGFVGSLIGKVWIADDFDEPLEDFKDYM